VENKKSNLEFFAQSVSFITQWERRCRNICARIFRNFSRIFDKSKLLGVRLHPLHHWLFVWKTVCKMVTWDIVGN